MGQGGRKGASNHGSTRAAFPLHPAPDKGLMLWGTLSAAQQEGRKEGIWKEQGGFQERDGKGRDFFRREEDELGDRSAWSSGDNPASGLTESQRSTGPLEWGGCMEKPQSSTSEVPSNPFCHLSSWKFPLKVLARSLHAILLQWDKHSMGVTLSTPKSISWGSQGDREHLENQECGCSPDP